MNKLIICTTGTSIANYCPSLREVQSTKSAWKEELKSFSKELTEKIKIINYHNEEERRKLSAELNTLDRLDLTKDDKVILLATDSAAGRICSEVNKKVIEEVYKCSVDIKQIEGLQVYNAKQLRQYGIKNLIRVILDNYLANDSIRYSYDIILNPTGGYKGIVPFLSILGMLYGKSSIYLFEFAEELIKLPPLPLTFDLNKYSRVKDALKYIEKEVAVREEEYLSKILDFDPSEKDLFLSFTENFDDDSITLSPLAYVLLKIEESNTPCQISQKVENKLNSINGEKLVILERLISNSSNPLWRQQNMHRWKDSEFLIIKQGNTSERLAGYMKNSVFHIALAFPNHDEYESELGKYKINDFDDEQYKEWSPKNIVIENGISTYDSLVREYDKLKYAFENKDKKIIENIEEKNITLEIKNEELSNKCHDINEQKEKLKKEISAIQQLSFIAKLKYLFLKY